MAKAKGRSGAGEARPRPEQGGADRPPEESTRSHRPADPRELEAHLRQFLEGFGLQPGEVADTPLGLAQQVMRQAHAIDDPAIQAQLAQKALEASTDCADAYVMLAELAPGPMESLPLYEEGVAAGERAMDQRAFLEDVGHFGGILETRPYMRARFGLAQTLASLGRLDEAIDHDWDLIRLNSRDNQGVRYHLAGVLLESGRLDDLARLIEQFDDEASTPWAYTRALLAFRRSGPGEASRDRLAEARRINPDVSARLLGEATSTTQPSEAAEFGDEDEAATYASEARRHWDATPGALDWLREAH